MMKNNFFSKSIQQLFFVALLFVTSFSTAQTKWADWDFTPPGFNFATSQNTPPSISNGSNVSGVTSLENARSANITPISGNSGGYQVPICGAINPSTSPYFEFTINHNSSNIDFDRLVLGGIRLNALTQNYDLDLRWSVDNYATTIATRSLPNNFNTNLVSFDISAQNNVISGAQVKFRIYFKNIVSQILFITFSNTFDTNHDSTPATYTTANKAISIWYSSASLPLSISSFNPIAAKAGESITITGSGFSNTASNNKVFFGSINATVTAASSTSLTVTVPVGVTTDKISVTNTATNLATVSNATFLARYASYTLASNYNSSQVDFITSVQGSTSHTGIQGAQSQYVINDINSDGKPDILSDINSSSVTHLTNNTSQNSSVITSNFTTLTSNVTGLNSNSMLMGDFNGDGKLDILSAQVGQNGHSYTNTSTSTTSFTSNSLPDGALFGWPVKFNRTNDGKISAFSTYSIHDGYLQGTLFTNTSTLNSTVNFTASTNSTALYQAAKFSTDANRDGQTDIISGHRTTGGAFEISFFRNNSGSLVRSTSSALSGFAVAANALDLNSDGIEDFVFFNQNGTVQAFANLTTQNATTLSLGAAVNVTTGFSSISGGTLADVNDDGKADIIVSGNIGVYCFLNTSSGSTISFSNTTIILANTSQAQFLYDLEVSDLNGDGKFEIIGKSTSRLRILNYFVPPSITLSSTNFTAFNTCPGVASVAQRFKVSASNLTANVAIGALTGYEFSIDSSSYSSTVSIPFGSGTLSDVSVHVRLTAASTGSPAGNISISSTNATTQTVAVTGSVLTNQNFGNALALNGSGKVQFANQAQTAVGNNFTVEAWVNVPSAVSNIQTILSNSSGIGQSGGFRFGINTWNTSDGRIVFEGGSVFVGSTVAIAKNVWQHVAVVVNNSVISHYINGVLVGTSTGSFPALSSTVLTLGSFSDDQYRFNGSMDEVRLWNIPKTQQEILASMYTQLSGTESDLVAYFNFNQGTPGGDNTGMANLIHNGSNSFTGGSLSEITRTGTAENFVANTNPMTITGSVACVGSTVQLYHPQTGGTWSSATSSVATVSSTGLVTCLTAGSSVVSYTYTFNNCQFTNTYTVTVNATPVAPTVANTSISYCQNATAPALSATAASGHTLRWYTVATGGTGATTAITPVTTTAGTFVFYVAQVNASGCEGPRVAITVTVSPTAVAGTATGAVTICSGLSTTLSLAGNTGTIQWQQSANGTSGWANVTAGSGATTTSYTTPNLNATTHYRAVVTSGVCTAVNSNVITVTVPQAPYPYDRAVNFTNGGSLVRNTTPSLNFTNFTVEAWINPTTFNNWAGIISKGAFQLMTTNTGTLAILFEDGWSWSWTQTPNVVLSLNQWQHVAASYNASTKETKLYVNGALVHTWIRTQSYVPNFSASALAIGTNNGTGNQPSQPYQRNFIGNIDEVKAWNTVRTDAQILANFATELAGNETGLVAYYKFNQGIGGGNNTAITSLTDLTSNANHLTPTSMAMNGSTNNIIQAGPTILNLPNVCLNETPTITHTNSGGTWSTSDATVISIDSNTGASSANTVGTATISYAYTLNGCNYTSTRLFTVNALPTAPVATTTVNLCQGITATALTATALTGNTLQWYTTATGGMASTTAPIPLTTTLGSTIFYVSQRNNVTGCEGDRTAITVNVNALPTISGVQNMTVGGATLQLTGSGTPNANSPWTSSNTAVATISTTGEVTAVAGGTTTITYTNTEGCSVTATLNVIDCNQPFGNALSFGNGTTAFNADFVQVNSRIFPSQTVTNFTIETWIRPAASDILSGPTGNNWMSFLGYSGSSVRSPSLYITNNGVLHASWTEGPALFGTPVSASSPTSLVANKWTHVALVKDGTTARLFVDGIQIYSVNCAATINVPDNFYWLGKSDNQFNGALDEVRFWSTARTQAQIQATMNAELLGNETGLLTYFDFNQGIAGGANTSITSVTNKANNALNGTLTNFTRTGTTSNFVGNSVASFDITGLASICANSTTQYTHPIAGGTWSLSNGASATISNSGLLTAASNESVTVSYTYTLNGCTKTATLLVTIASPDAPVTTTAVNLCQGISASALSATALTGNTLRWYTTATGGTASTTAPIPSTATLGATIFYVSQRNTATTCESSRTAITVTVNAIPTIAGIQNMTVGGSTLQLSGSGTPSANSPWISSNTGIATISSTGEVTAVAGGTTIITYTNAEGCSITAPINVIDCNQPFGNALSFDGSNDFVTIGDNIENLSDITTEAWVFWRGSSNAFSEIITKDLVSAFAITSSNKLHANFGNGFNWDVGLNSIASIPLNTWTHVAVTRQNGSVKLFINGVQDAAVATMNFTGQNSSHRAIGGKLSGATALTGSFINGALDEVRFWSTARTQAQIAASMYTELIGNETGLSAYFDFNQGIAGGNNSALTTVTNKANNTLNGTLTNFTRTGTSSNFVANTITSFPINGAAIVCANSTAQYTHPVSGGTWTLSNGAAATISNTGLLTSAANENVTVSYTYTINGCSKTATRTITIESTLISGLTSVGAGNTITLTATTTPASNNAWVSSNPSKATVSASGVVTGLSTGTTIITFTNNNGCTDTALITIVTGTTLAPTLILPATNTTGATTLSVQYTLPETPLAGSVRLTFTPVGGGTPIVWTMNNATSATFSYVVGTLPTTIANVTAGTALGFTTYDVMIAYQDAFSNPSANDTNTNVQTLAPPAISFVSSSYATVVNSTLTINTINTGGSMVTYSISPTLPTGFTFNTTTGVITGSSSVALSATTYTVTATNAAGSDTEPFSLAITADTDGDGIPNIADADVNNDGVIDNGPDTDGDGIIDLYDNDIDGDGIPNNLDNDADGDGVPNSQDVCAFIPNTAITVQPITTNQVICPSATINPLTVTATGPGLSYQWYRNTTATTTGGTLLTGATSASYSPLNTVVGTAYYYVVVTGTCGTATSNVSGSILVTDVTLPTVVTQNRTIYLNASGQATVTAAQIDNGSTDNCGIATRTLSQTTFNCNNIGANTVTLTVTDVSGNIRTGNATVTVVDSIKPTVVTQNITVNLNASGQATITAAQINNGSSDNCGIASVTVNQTAFTCANTGANTVTLTVTDVNGNVKTKTATVTVVDNSLPSVVTQNVIRALNASGQVTVTANEINNGSTDNCGIGTVALSQTVFTCAHVGVNTVTLTVTDTKGNTATGQATVTIIDNTPPTAIAQNINAYLNAGGAVTVTPNQVGGNSTDNCSIATMTLNNTTFNCSNLGANPVILTVVDPFNNVSTANAVITVVDSIKPLLTIPADITVNANSGCGAFGFPIGTASATDNCSVISAITNNAPTFYPVGVTNIIYSVTDGSGNTKTKIQKVTVIDNVIPIITAPANISTTLTAGCTKTGLNLGTPVTSDNCTIASVTNNAPTAFPVGTTIVTWTVTDASGNTATATQNVTVTDAINPTITAPANLTINANASCVAFGVNLGTPVRADNCTVASVTNNAPAVFPIGSTTVTWTVTDAAGNTATATQTVTVVDNTAPLIFAPAGITVNISTGCTVANLALGTPVTMDNCSTVTVSNNAPTTFPIGVTTVTWTATDGAGNTATATQVVTIVDNTDPTIVAPAAVMANLTTGCTATGIALGTPTTADNCTVASVTNNAPTTYPIGTTIVTWTVTDGAGNTATTTQLVTITDNTNPTITAPAAITATTNAGCTATGIVLGTPVTADNCTVASVTNNAPTVFPIGTTTITWVVTDGAGNATTATQLVTITDAINPTITAPANIIVNTNSGCTATGIALGSPVTADNCSVVSVTNNAPTTFPIGTTTVTWVVTDGAGNTASTTQTVTVNDVQLPTITPPANVTQYVSSGCTVNGIVIGTPVTADNCTVASVTNDAPGTFPIGTTTVTWTVTDGAGNSAVATQVIQVIDTIAPTPLVNDVTVALDLTGTATITSSMIDAGSFDNCGLESIVLSQSLFGCNDLGTNVVQVTITDSYGNSAIAFVKVTITPSGIDVDMDGIDDACDEFVNTQVVQVPSGFSPNGDKINDTFIIPALDQFTKVQLQVFNKYGHEVYVSPLYKNDWNGTSSFNGMELPDDTYFYILNTDGELHQGFVYINRVK